MVELGERIKRAAAEQFPAVHPENPEIHTINQILFAAPLERTEAGVGQRTALSSLPGRLDRSPCGAGTSARLAVMHARGQIKEGERFYNRSILDTEFVGETVETLSIGGKPGIRPTINGSAWITAFYQYVLDASAPFPTGYTLSDLWRARDRSNGLRERLADHAWLANQA